MRLNAFGSAVLAGVFSLVSLPANAGAVENAAELMASWQPDKISLEGGTLVVVLPQQRITEQIYLSILQAGVCFGPLLDIDLPGVSSIQILNRGSKQGYVYEKGMEDCEKLNSYGIGGDQFKFDVLAATHSY
jgi:hypothetical protein